jgi:hypothetical protein
MQQLESKYKPLLKLPSWYVDSKVWRGFSDFTGFILATSFLLAGVHSGKMIFGAYTAPGLQISHGKSYSMILAGDAGDAYSDGSKFEFSYNTKVVRMICVFRREQIRVQL